MEEPLKWLNANASAIQAVSAVVSVVVTAILVRVTYTYVQETKCLRRLSEDNLQELQRQHLEHQEQSQLEKEELRKTYMAPIEWTQTSHGQRAMWFSYELDLQNLGPGSAKEVRVRAYLIWQEARINRVGFIPGLVAGASERMSLRDVDESYDVETWGIETWGTSTPTPNLEMAVEIRCKTILDEEMPPVRTIVNRRSD